MRDQSSDSTSTPATAIIRPRVIRPSSPQTPEDLKGPLLLQHNGGTHPVLGSSPTECLGCFHDVCVPFAPSHLCQRNSGEPPPNTLDRELNRRSLEIGRALIMSRLSFSDDKRTSHSIERCRCDRTWFSLRT
ncbi:phosphatidylinositol 3-kinase regulatory subunit alpha [Caerostris extrusa]|uniref:Phosphatidylinositol 3-kinase regulatory subunit alpha n=1 Tax=Caerostris extrusa TaxID=172846 RepID=A0AAV4YDF6_CAEEX|nr:phosphatidylinositol 3-kinase regulatory subunit alpha [Caerostris extrusa]